MPLSGRLEQSTSNIPLIRSVSSVAFAVGGGRPFNKAVELAAHWMQKLNSAVPDAAAAGQDFDVGGGGAHPARAVTLNVEEVRIWSATIDNPDRHVLGRTWITEITVAERRSEVHVGTRLLNVSRQQDESFVPTIPRLVSDIIKCLPCATDGVDLSDAPTYISSESEVEQLITLLERSERRLPVIVMAEAVNRPPLIELERIARRVCGAAHVFGITDRCTWQLTDRVGRGLSVFDGAVRLYWPNFKVDDADPYDHPLWIADQGRTTLWGGVSIIARVLAAGVSRGTTAYPRFDAVRQAAAEQSLAAKRIDSSDAEIAKLLEEENAALRHELTKLRTEQNQWLADAEGERSSAERQVSELKSEIHRVRNQTDTLRKALSEAGKPATQESLRSFIDFTAWLQRNVSTNIWFTPKSMKEAERNGQYRKPEEVGEAIRMLDELYVPALRDGDKPSQKKFQDRMSELGLTISDCFARENDIKRFTEYSAVYRGERVWCNQHLRKGGGTDPRSMFRIYFHWHEDDSVLIIGYLPTHLDNNMTN